VTAAELEAVVKRSPERWDAFFAAFNGPDGDALVSPGSVWPVGLHADEVHQRFVAELFRECDGVGRSD